ncbi:DNA repair protein RecO [Acidithiobacillus sp. IBUN Pt1247-S3]|uniref:DNA repair protein RecO n=1 Tax=Acidithiobacillus sp. IBUN Pt1247-S3 TaxID=3166642 RepID=UPI0034E56D18
MERNHGERVWVLHHHPFGDGSLILELFTEHHGRLGVLARGKRRSGRLEAGRPYWVRWAGHGELPVLQGAEELPSPLTHCPVPALLLFYLNELLLRLTERADPQAEIFVEYSRTLHALAQGTEEYWLLRRFERRLLEALGWAADLAYCAHCGIPLTDAESYASAGAGMFCSLHRPALAQPLPLAALTWLASDMQSAPERALWGELRAYLAGELDQTLAGRPLESRRLLAAYLQRRRGSNGGTGAR